MSELTITLLRLGYLAVLWLFVFAAIGVLRKDIYGTRITARPTDRPAPRRNPVRPSQPVAPQATRLVVTEGRLSGTTIPLSTSAVLIGRAPACTLVLDDDYASGRHARVFYDDKSWFVEDLGSTNGTHVNGERITAPTQLQAGTQLRIGTTVLELRR